MSRTPRVAGSPAQPRKPGPRSRWLLTAVAALVLCAPVLTACGGEDGGSESVEPRRAKAGEFGRTPATGANRWFPLKPGYQSVRLGEVTRGSRRISHRRVFTVTDVTKVINGVRTIVALDQDFDGGQIGEQALDYFAEDEKGNVWYFGSYTETYEGGQFVNASDAWLDGVNGGRGGLYMPARPRVGMAPYAQEHAPDAEPSIAEIVRTGVSKCVPFKCYDDVLVVEEDGSENKYFAPGVGGILTEPTSEGGEEETEKLINLTQLSPRGLAELSAEALRLDRHAATTAPDVFGQSEPATRMR